MYNLYFLEISYTDNFLPPSDAVAICKVVMQCLTHVLVVMLV